MENTNIQCMRFLLRKVFLSLLNKKHRRVYMPLKSLSLSLYTKTLSSISPMLFIFDNNLAKNCEEFLILFPKI